MASVSNSAVIEIFKRVYGNMSDLVPEDYILSRDIPWSEKQKVGEKYIEAVALTNEAGISYGGSGQDAFEFTPPVAGSVRQAEVAPYITVLSSLVPFGTISRSAGSGDKAFYEATKWIVRNNIKSHGKFKEIDKIYGQADAQLGYVSYATATYRGVAFVNGTGTLNGVAFTNGINAAGKYILLAPGQFSAGIWVGLEGVRVNQINSSGVIVAAGTLVSVNTRYGYLQVDFTPVAASSVTSHRLCFDGMQNNLNMPGLNKIMSTSGTLFGIPTANYALWRGNQVALGNVKLTLGRIQDILSDAVNAGGLDGDVTLYCNPRSWATLATTEAGLRVYDSSYSSSKAKNSFEDLEFFSQTGKITVKAHRFVKEGEAYILHLPDWSCSGSAQIGFNVPGIDDGKLIYPLENQAAYAFRSYADMYLFCHAPARSVIVTGINDESAT